MSREIRRVPPRWEHPRFTSEHPDVKRYPYLLGRYVSKHARTYEEALSDEASDRAEYDPKEFNGASYEEFYGSEKKNPENYMPAVDEATAWYQVYETVSEGSPVTPPFETTDELINWLVNRGTNYGTPYEERYSIKGAESLVQDGWVPSGALIDGSFKSGSDLTEALADRRDEDEK